MPKITKTTVDNLTPGLLEQWVWDSEVPGFGVRCTPAGRKTYVARYRTKAGVQRKSVLARCSDVPPDKARELARKLFAQVAEGLDPVAERKPAPKERGKTVGEMFQAYADSMKEKGRASATEVERALLKAENNAADALGRDKPASAITSADVVAYVAGIYQAGHRGAADKHRSYIASAYAWAIKSANDYTVTHRQDWGLKGNPAADVPKDSGAVKQRDRNLSAAELKRLWQDTRIDSPGFAPETAACIRVLIACGQRVQETLRMDGCEVDLQALEWRIPAEKTKGRKHPHTVPLPRQIVPDLQLLINLHGSGPLFAGRDGQPMDHPTIMQAIERWYTRTGVAPLQTRDLRRTWKSRSHDAGIDRFTRDLIQQHAKSDTGSKNDDRAEYLPQMREAMKKWGDWIQANLEETAVLTLVA